MALMDASHPGSRELYADEARKFRNSEGWHYADELSHQGAALARVADYVATRTDHDRPAQPERVQAARARSATGTRPVPPDASRTACVAPGCPAPLPVTP
ncbi:hypothetical protein GCM10017688_15310 [Streptomyces ramulosus]